MLSRDEKMDEKYYGSCILENSGNGQLRLSCFAEDYALRANCINSYIGRLSVVSFAANIFKIKNLSGYRLNVKHPQYVSHTLKEKRKPFKINLLGPLYLTEKHKQEKPKSYAKSILLFFKPWLKTPCTLKSHVTWVESLNSWQFKD